MSADLLRYLAGFLAMETFESFALTCKEAAAATVAEHERRECIRQALGVVFAWASEEAMPELLKEPSGENDGHMFDELRRRDDQHTRLWTGGSCSNHWQDAERLPLLR